MKVLTWNVEWSPSGSERTRRIQSEIAATNPDVVCYTEVLRQTLPDQHVVEADPDYGYAHPGDRRKVCLWSNLPWTDIERGERTGLPGGRFVSAVTNGIRFVGVCIPWRDAHVRTGRKDREPWQDHLDYCAALAPILREYAAAPEPLCVLGDFNQRLPRKGQPQRVADALAAVWPESVRVVTAGKLDLDGRLLIDHIALSSCLVSGEVPILPKTTGDELRLSDRVGVALDFEFG